MRIFRLIVMAVACVAGFARAAPLAEIRDKGVMSVAVYNEFAPFSEAQRGIDVEVAKKLGERLGVEVSFLPFDADESMDDDLRNMVWRGSLLGYGPADVMMHVPVDPAFALRNDKVAILAAYFRDTLQIARSLERLPELRDMNALEHEPVGVEVESLGAMILATPQGTRPLKSVHHYMDMGQAFADLRSGKLSAVLALGSQAQAAMTGVKGYAVELAPLPGRVPPGGWTYGIAVKSEHASLADALKAAMAELERDGSLDAIFAAHGVQRLKP